MTIFSTPIQTQGLRKCQRQAYEALLKHFGSSNAPRSVIVELPTGTGKTGLLAVAPFGLSRARVLILMPNVKLAKDISDALDIVAQPDSNVFKRFGLVDAKTLDEMELFVLRLEGAVSKNDLREHQIIVANYHQLQDVEKWFEGQSDLIDLIIIDEAHHQAAETYQEVLAFFPTAKVIGLTATPFRTDSKKLDGERIYKYHFHEAIADGVIRNIRVSNVSPEHLTLGFTDQASTQYSLKDVLKLKEQAWFNRGIALSQDCCDSIARKAKEKLEELRKDFPNEPHQIIAAAISKRHAREFVKPAFEKLGLKVGLVSSAPEDVENNEDTFAKLKQGKLDVIIHIGMLGEGFDHPPLGVAAIFRPYKSLNPYIQFIGRVIRRHGETPYSYVVSHLGMNQLQRFEEFKLFDYEDQQFLKQLFEEDPTADQSFAPDQREGGVRIERESPEIKEIDGQMLEFEGAFVANPKSVDKLVDQVKSLGEAELASFLEKLGIRSKTKITLSAASTPKRLKPIDKKKASRNLLNEKEKSIAVDALKALGKGMYGRDYNPLYANFAWVKKYVSKLVNERLEIGKAERKHITNEQYAKMDAEAALSDIHQAVVKYFSGKKIKSKKK